ncbi:unnamed protein product, partial [Ectocarpus sp. 4 AP-2014]
SQEEARPDASESKEDKTSPKVYAEVVKGAINILLTGPAVFSSVVEDTLGMCEGF